MPVFDSAFDAGFDSGSGSTTAAAFDLSFDGSFDSGSGSGGGPVALETGQATLGLAISVVSPLVFASGASAIRWSPVVVIGGVDVSARLTGAISVSAAEDSARVASFSVVPASPAELWGFDGKTLTIDVALFKSTSTAVYRLFTGIIERCEFDPVTRVAQLACRDGWQERPLACASAADVEALLGGLATPSAAVAPWSATEPDPAAYFSTLLDTLPGATAIDANGLWRVIPWSIGAPLATFTADDVFDDSVRVLTAARADVPSAVKAALAVRYHRLHAAEVDLNWTAVANTYYVVDGLPTLPKSTVMEALQGVSGWLIKGKPAIVEPLPGSFPVLVGGDTVYYIVSPEFARTTCHSFTATLYRRWYQEVELSYTITIDMGGASNRDESIRASVASTFDASAWETAPSAESASGLYQANAPTVTAPPTGYEGLPAPFPPTNGALDHLGDIALPDLQAAAQHVVARAVRKAASGKRHRRVIFERPLDPRWEIGAVLAVNACGVAAVGQVSELEHTLDIDSGAAASTFTLAVPESAGASTTFTATVAAPSASVTHALTDPTLGTHVGASYDTPAVPTEDDLLGFLCNVVPTSANYDASKPVYEPQFRLILPEIAAPSRDPLTVEAPISASVAIAGGSLTLTF